VVRIIFQTVCDGAFLWDFFFLGSTEKLIVLSVLCNGLFVETNFCYIAHCGLELPPSPECWDYMCAPYLSWVMMLFGRELDGKWTEYIT
jgi:hypothetical protein